MNSSNTNRTHLSTATARLRIRRRRRRCGEAPQTPLLHWTFYNTTTEKKKPHRSFSSRAHEEAAGDGAKFCGGSRRVELSARKLAAGLCQLRLSAGLLRCRNDGFGSKHRSSDRLRFGPVGRGDVNMVLSQDHSSREHCTDAKHLRRSQSGAKQRTFCRLESLFPHSKRLKDEAIKWDSRCSEASIEWPCFASRMKLLEDQVKTFSFVSAVQAELVQAQYIHDLEHDLRSCRKKVKYLLRKLGEESTSRQKKEHDQIYAVIDDMKVQLSRERKRLQKMDIINSRLVKELAEARSSAIELVQIYEKEKRNRELLEEVCNELARKIGEDKAEAEALRIEAMKFRDELEEERNMLQVAEVLREERVQMKLVDAKLALESKYSRMNKLMSILETFLMSRITSLDLADLRAVELIGQAVKSVDIQDMDAFSCDPMRSGDLFSILEELLPIEVCEKETESCVNNSSTGAVVSVVHPAVSPEKNNHDNDNVPNDLSIITFGGCKIAPRCELEQVEIAGGGSPNTETSEIGSMSAVEQPKWLRTSCASSSGFYKAISEEGKGRLSNGTFSILGTNFPNRKSVKGGVVIKHKKPMGQCGSTELVNPHIARGMKGCIEWPKGKPEREKTQSNTLNTG